MKSLLRPALTMLGLFSLLTGILYPLAVTGLAQALMPRQANGSLIERDGKPVGSELIGQPFQGSAWFWSRPSATTPFPDNASASTGSNLGPSNPVLGDAIAARVETLRRIDPHAGPPPIDLVTTSASGLDPHLSVASVYFQLPRVARARGMTEAALRMRIEGAVEPRTLGVLGEPRINVLKLNLSLPPP